MPLETMALGYWAAPSNRSGLSHVQLSAGRRSFFKACRSVRRADGAELHAVDQAVVREDVGHDNQFVASPHAFRFHEERNRLLNRVVGIRFERQYKTFNRTQELELAQHF